ncbi:MAG: putative amino acid permease YhdG [Bacteroidetes bacterium ADurb.Bin397]|nr:MAG: putative amino acid permease YhdG [Bacteroidetes bacterium ADurb.Bin397]
MNLFRKKSIHDILQQVKEGDESVHGKLKKHLGVRDLTAFGIAAIIGAGIFSTIGKASADGGPAVILLFIFTALACSLAAFCYAEFSSMVPVSGSAYTYSYVSFGELFAWIIGWALIMEYAIGNIVVAISWSGYFSSLLTHLHIPALGFPDGIHLPAWSGIDYFSAKRAFESAAANPADTAILNSEGYLAWISAPVVAGIKIIMDIPALVINILITWLVYRGIKETRNASNMMVAIKVSVVIMVIALGISYVDTDNWTPFMPEGLGGVLAGVSAVFFAYIGFDAISTTAEECHNPQRDLPKGMMYAIIICTVLYILIALVLTGMVNYTELAVDDPLAFVFSRLGLDWISGIIAVSAVVAMASVLLVFQLGQPRIWMSMSRDGLLPKAFSSVHPKYGTPGFATIVTGLLVGVPIFFIDMNTVVDLCSIGTLFAFILVCGGVLMLQKHKELPRKFKVPYINGKFIVPVLYLITTIYVGFYQREWAHENLNPLNNAEAIPMFIFFIVFAVLAFYSATRNLSLIPVLGILTCLYLMAQIHLKNWIGFTIWLAAGLVIYFGFSYKNSKLNKARLQS